MTESSTLPTRVGHSAPNTSHYFLYIFDLLSPLPKLFHSLRQIRTSLLALLYSNTINTSDIANVILGAQCRGPQVGHHWSDAKMNHYFGVSNQYTLPSSIYLSYLVQLLITFSIFVYIEIGNFALTSSANAQIFTYFNNFLSNLNLVTH